MRFDSWEYLVLLAGVTVLHPRLPVRLRWLFLLIASLLCYGWEEPWILGPLLVTTVVDFQVARAIAGTEDPGRRKHLLVMSLAANLGLLFLFKYLGFVQEILRGLFAHAGITWPVASLVLTLPAGISFYTFQSIAYTVDVYRRRLEPETHFGRFALYVSFFPQLVAGPIERAAHLMPQLDGRTSLDIARVAPALDRILWGLFKKMVIADRLAIYVDAVYGDPLARDGLSCLIATWFFAFQIYCDFSGYTDIAIGSARLIGVELTENFDRPYLATDIRDFWHRWHITLSTWLRDYLYVPLGGNRHGPARKYLSLFLTMYLGGLWHGASWTFVLWGAYHGILLLLHHMVRDGQKNASPRGPLSRAFGTFVTFHLVLLSWILFRATDVWQAVIVLVRILAAPWRTTPSITDVAQPGLPLDLGIDAGLIVALLAGWALIGRGPVDAWTRRRSLPLRLAIRLGALAGILILAPGARNPFLYFQF